MNGKKIAMFDNLTEVTEKISELEERLKLIDFALEKEAGDEHGGSIDDILYLYNNTRFELETLKEKYLNV